MKITVKLLPLAAFALLAACNKAPSTPAAAPATPAEKPVATVNGQAISKSMFDYYVKSSTGKASTDLSADQRSQVLDNLVRGELVAQDAEKQGLDKGADVSAQLAFARVEILEQAGAEHYLKDKQPTDDELKAEYDEQVLAMPKAQYHARHILVATQDQAQKLIDQLKKGAKFEELAKANSTDASKDMGGDLGWVTQTSVVAPFYAALSTLKKNEYTQTPVQTQYGWHVIQLLDTRDTPVPPFDQVKDRVKNLVMNKKFKAYADDLAKTAKVDKNPT